MALFVQAQFVEIGAAVGLDAGGRKDGGVSWGDFNQDGCPDVIFNTDNATGRSRLFLSDCNLPNPTFSDVTATHAAGLLNETCERSIVWADFNNDGYLDFARNSNPIIELYLNKGPSASPPYSFGTATQGPNLQVTTISGGMNTEGMGWIDFNEDGWLDLVVDNHNFGIDIFENPADGSAAFDHVTPNGSSMGLPEGARTGDYMCLSDYDDNGTVDILCRKENEFDIWTNGGAAAATQFSALTSFNQQANNGNKGGVLFADFDNDGDFDLFWGDAGSNPNQIFLQTAPGVFTATGEPAASSGVNLTTGINIDGCAAADVDHDGKIDLFLNNGSGTGFLFRNNTPNGGTLSFTQANNGINVNANGEGCAFVDYDLDGDMDLYVNINNGTNQLWRNQQNDANFLKVRARYDLGNGLSRDDIGATVTLLDCDGNVVGGIRDVNGTRGHGSQDFPEIHFGLPNGPAATYILRVGFTSKNGTRKILERAFIPNLQPDQTIVLADTDLDDLTACTPLSVSGGIRDLSVESVTGGLSLYWTADESPATDRYLIQRLGDSREAIPLGELAVSGNRTQASYQFEDRSVTGTTALYRVVQLDREGQVTGMGEVEWNGRATAGLEVSPNPVAPAQAIQLELVWPEEARGMVRLYDGQGREVAVRNLQVRPGINSLALDPGHLPPGVYLLVATVQGQHLTRKVLLQ